MAYQTGSIITAADINSLANEINKLRGDRNSNMQTIETGGFGYGQSDITVSATPGTDILATEYSSYYTSLNQIAQHLGRSELVPPGSTVTIGQLIQAYPTFLTKITELSNNRFLVAAGNTSSTSGGSKLSDSRSNLWKGSINHEIRANFTTLNAARYFFNSGGRIILSQVIGSINTTADSELQNVFNQLSGTYVDYEDFYPVSSTYRTVASAVSGSTSANIQVRYQSGYVYIALNITSGGASYVTSPISSRVDERRSVGIFDVPGASYDTLSSIALGGNVVSPFTSVVISGGGTYSCIYSSGAGCFVDFTLSATTTGGSGTYVYNWTVSDSSNYSIISGQGTSTVVIRSATGTTNLPSTVVSVVVNDPLIAQSQSATTTIDADKISGITSVSVVSSGGNTGTCYWDYDASTYPTACAVNFNLSATPVGGLGPYNYNWTSNNANYTILSGQGTNNIVVRSSSGTSNLPLGVLSCSVSDPYSSNSGSVTLTANRVPGPITDVIITPNGGNTYSCNVTSPATTCTVNSSYTTVVRGGSGNYTFSNTKQAGGSETIMSAFNASTGSFTVSTTSGGGASENFYRSFTSNNVSSGTYVTSQGSFVFSQNTGGSIPNHSLLVQGNVLNGDPDAWLYNGEPSVATGSATSRFVQQSFPYSDPTDTNNYEFKVEIISVPAGAVLFSGSQPATTYFYSSDCINTWVPESASFSAFVRNNSSSAVDGTYTVRWFTRVVGQSGTEQVKTLTMVVSSRAL